MQVRFKERENPFEGCLLGDSGEEEEGYDEYPDKEIFKNKNILKK